MTALVTGASGGLGAEICLALARAGHDIAVHYRGDADGADATARLVESTAGRHTITVHADLAVEDAAELDTTCADLLARAEAGLGPLTAVVLNAFPQHVIAWDALDTAGWDHYHRAGLRPTTALLHAAGRRLAAGAALVAIGSVEELRPAPGHAPYGVAKAALRQLVAAAATELGPRGIRIVGVAPGLIERPGLAEHWPEGVERWRRASALARPVTAAEVAATTAFLASPAASGITGTTVLVDAGWSATAGW